MFVEAQVKEAMGFFKCIRNFSCAAQRFNSVTAPLTNAFALFPAVLRFLSDLTQKGDHEDKAWSRRLLEALTAKDGGASLVKAAMAGDAFLVLEQFLRLDDRSDSAAVLKAEEVPSLICSVQALWLF